MLIHLYKIINDMFKKKQKYVIRPVEYCSGIFINCKFGEFSSDVTFDKIHLIDPNCRIPNK